MLACSAAAAGYLGLGIALARRLSRAAQLRGGSLQAALLAARADLDRRFLSERRRLQGRTVPAPGPGYPPGDELTDAVDKLFNRYFNGNKYVPDKPERERWNLAVAGFRRFYRDEIIQDLAGATRSALIGWPGLSVTRSGNCEIAGSKKPCISTSGTLSQSQVRWRPARLGSPSPSSAPFGPSYRRGCIRWPTYPARLPRCRARGPRRGDAGGVSTWNAEGSPPTRTSAFNGRRRSTRSSSDGARYWRLDPKTRRWLPGCNATARFCWVGRLTTSSCFGAA